MIHALLVAAALALPASAQNTADVLGPARRGELDVYAADWTSWRDRSNRVLEAFKRNAAAAGVPGPDADYAAAKVHFRAEEWIAKARGFHDEILNAIRKFEAPSPARLAREKEVERSFEATALEVYAVRIPKWLDEALQDKSGNNVGARYTGPEASAPFTSEECLALTNWHGAQIPLTPAESDWVAKRVP